MEEGTPRPAAIHGRATVTSTFTTDGLGLIPGADGDVDYVIRREAWEQAHPGGTIGKESPDGPGYIACWPDGAAAARSYASLGSLMTKLDRAEAEGRCPVHGEPS